MQRVVMASILGGAIAGAGSSLLFIRLSAGSAPPPPVSSPSENRTFPIPGTVSPLGEAQSPPGSAARDERVGSLENRITQLEDQKQPPAPPQDIARDQAKNFAAHAASIEAHRRDKVDPGWARDVERAYNDDLQAISRDSQFRLLNVNCRTTSCIAELEFANFNIANQNWSKVLHRRYKTACGTEISIPPTDKPDEPYRATVVFDCLSMRSE
jgi:hypothetical protein